MPDENEIDWNSCPPFDGPEASQPTGMAHMPAGIPIIDLVKDGSIERTKSGGIISLEIDNEMYRKLVNTYGAGQILIGTADGDRLTREQWYEKFGHTDGLILAAIKSLNKLEQQQQTGHSGGVIVHRPDGTDLRKDKI